MHKVKLEIYYIQNNLDQYLEYQINLNLLAWVHKVTSSTLDPIILYFNQLSLLKETPQRHPNQYKLEERQL